MPSTLGYDGLTQMLHGAADAIRDNHTTLSQLDSVGGDGDHGATMMRAMTRVEAAIKSCETPTVKALLYDVGWAILGVDGGATGPLFGALFMAMSEAVGEAEALDAPLLAHLFEAGLEGVARNTRAQPGDKTMIDALTPAVNAMRAAADAGADVVEMLRRAASAAHDGAASTATMQARFGRAKNIKEQSIGHPDPGATSTALLFQGFQKGIETHA